MRTAAWSRRWFVLAVVMGVLGAWAGPALAQPASDTVSLVILHTNDTHGHLLPFSYPSVLPEGSELADLPAKKDIGGIARRATLVKRIRADVAARGGHTWLVDLGDFTDGTPFSTEFKGEADLAAMNAAGYQLGTLGNHEFNAAPEWLPQLLTKAAYPMVLANATVRATGASLLPPYRIERLGNGPRIAVFGLVTKSTQGYPAARNHVAIGDEIEAAKALVPKLRAEADVVILLSHCGTDLDEKLAAQVPGIDVIIGGHSHTRLPFGQMVWHSDDLRADTVDGTIIAQAHQWGGEVGRLDLLFRKGTDGRWHVARNRSRLVPVTAELPADPEVAAIVDTFWKPIAPKYGAVVGTAAADFSSRGDDDAPYSLVADAVRETYGVEVEFENAGGVRAPLVAGPITVADLVTMDPFNNTVILFEATGAQLKQLMARNAPYVSGLRYRLVDGVVVEATVDGKPLDDARVYKAATNSYFASVAMKGYTVTDTKRSRLDVVTEYIRKKGTITPAYDGRRVVMGPRRRFE